MKHDSELEIVVVINYPSETISDAAWDGHNDRIAELPFSASQLEDYRNNIRSFVSVIHNAGFKVVKEHHDNKNQSYEITFKSRPYPELMDETLDLDVRFRLTYGEKYTLIVGSVSYDNIAAAMLTVKNQIMSVFRGMCDGDICCC